MSLRSFTLNIPATTWIPRDQHRAVAKLLIENSLSRIDNARQLPLANGGTTDLYVDLRPARSNPDVNMTLARLFAHPLRWLGVDRILEVPDAISGIAALTSSITGIPYATIRKQPKEGRASDAQIIGHIETGENVAIIDDVVTDGESKIAALRLCAERELNVRAIIVLVDRQQGWQLNLARKGLDVPVWAGMTLHDFRREAILMGTMERCGSPGETKNPIIVALDGKSLNSTLEIADRLRPTGCLFKVNDLIIAQGVDRVLPELQTYGRVMVDIKAHDIPNTVNNCMDRIQEYEPWAITVHASGGWHMISNACARLRTTKVLAVTVLTSFDADVCEEVYHALPHEQVKYLAKVANRAGADGFVCSPDEVAMLSETYPGKIFVTPGVRSPGVGEHDQKRVDTPANAIKKGATHVVIGRQILGAPDPVAEVNRIMAEELMIT